MTTFTASFEDAARCAEAAKAEGWIEGEDGMLDYVEPSSFQTAKKFSTKEEAVAWLVEQINAMRTCFGSGDVTENESIPPASRCQYCICHGELPVKRYLVTHDGIESEESEDGICHSDDDES